DSDQVHAGEPIWAWGHPESVSSTDSLIGAWLSPDSDLEPTVSPGSITAIKRNLLNAPVFQSNAGIMAGMSGGPDVNLAGDVVAISTWARSGAASIKFIVAANVTKSFLAQALLPLHRD